MSSGIIKLDGVSSGHFTLKRIKQGAVVQSIEFTNLITDHGLERMASVDGESLIQRIYVGTGTTPPEFTDTTLQNPITDGNGTISRGISGTAPYHVWARSTITFGVGAAAGNISEVGAGPNSSPYLLFSRALVVDALGNPTTITVLPDEQLQVVYEHRHYMSTDDVVGEFTLTGNLGGTYGFIARPSQVTVHNTGNNFGWSMQKSMSFTSGGNYAASAQVSTAGIGTITGWPSGGETHFGSSGGSSVVSGENKVRHTVNFALGNGNLPGGIKSLRKLMGYGVMQFEFDPPIPKTAEDVLSLTLEQSWGRA